MAIVKSPWTTNPIPVDGLLPAAEWAGAGTLPIPAGYLMVRNDANFLYVALDLIDDLGNDPSPYDYFWFVVDVDNNGAITPHRDLLFGPWPGNPSRLGKWPLIGPNTTEPAPNNQVIASTTRAGFGPSSHSSTPHRIWEIKFSLSELGVDLVPSGPPPSVKFGLRVVSWTPAFTFDFPSNPTSSFAGFHTILLATAPASGYPAGTAGVVIGGVGLIPATKIGADGYATIEDTYAIKPDEAAFGGTLSFLANSVTLQSLIAAGATHYKVLRRFGVDAAALAAATFAPIRCSWSNYRWTGTTYVLEPFGPDAEDKYRIVNPTVTDYSIKDLLLSWSTGTEPDLLHQFQVQFFNDAGAVVASPVQSLTVRVDNNLPEVALLDVTHNGASVTACALVTLTGPEDGLRFMIRAFDAEGDLSDYALTAEYGDNGKMTIASDGYSSHRSRSHVWQGVTSLTVPADPWAPPQQCAYLFRLTATARVTDGYNFPVGSSSTFRTITLLVPGSPRPIAARPSTAAASLPFGFAANDKLISAGTTPARLGADSLKG